MVAVELGTSTFRNRPALQHTELPNPAFVLFRYLGCAAKPLARMWLHVRHLPFYPFLTLIVDHIRDTTICEPGGGRMFYANSF